MADAELEEPFAELLAPLCLTDVDPAASQHVFEAGYERGKLKVGQIGVHPLFDWTPAVIVLEELDGELAGTHWRDDTRRNGQNCCRGRRRTSCPFASLQPTASTTTTSNQTPTVPVRDIVRLSGPVRARRRGDPPRCDRAPARSPSRYRAS